LREQESVYAKKMLTEGTQVKIVREAVLHPKKLKFIVLEGDIFCK